MRLFLTSDHFLSPRTMKDTGYSSPDKIRRSGAPRGAPTARSEIKEETRQVESPLIILKRKIEDRRRARGEEELKIDFTSPPVQHEVSCLRFSVSF